MRVIDMRKQSEEVSKHHSYVCYEIFRKLDVFKLSECQVSVKYLIEWEIGFRHPTDFELLSSSGQCTVGPIHSLLFYHDQATSTLWTLII